MNVIVKLTDAAIVAQFSALDDFEGAKARIRKSWPVIQRVVRAEAAFGDPSLGVNDKGVTVRNDAPQFSVSIFRESVAILTEAFESLRENPRILQSILGSLLPELGDLNWGTVSLARRAKIITGSESTPAQWWPAYAAAATSLSKGISGKATFLREVNLTWKDRRGAFALQLENVTNSGMDAMAIRLLSGGALDIAGCIGAIAELGEDVQVWAKNQFGEV